MDVVNKKQTVCLADMNTSNNSTGCKTEHDAHGTSEYHNKTGNRD